MITQDEDLYRRMAQPRSPEEVTVSQEEFLREVEELRIKHKITELLVVCVSYQTPNKDIDEGERGNQTRVMAKGNSQVTPMLAAIAYKRYAVPQINAAKRLERFANNEADDEDGGDE